MSNDISLIVVLAFSTLLPFIIASGTCYIKFSIVFIMVRNALGIQQVPSNMTLNGIALILSMFVMTPVIQNGYNEYRNGDYDLESVESVNEFVDQGLGSYRSYLKKYSDVCMLDTKEIYLGGGGRDMRTTLFIRNSEQNLSKKGTTRLKSTKNRAQCANIFCPFPWKVFAPLSIFQLAFVPF